MDLLFRLDQKSAGFENIDKARVFFDSVIKERDNYHFFDTRNAKQVEKGDQIYFSYDSQIVAICVFDGEIIENRVRDPKFIYGHKLSKIQVVKYSKRLSNKIFGPRSINYLKTQEMHDEVSRTLTINLDIYPDNIEGDFVEGSSKKVLVNKYERDPKARQACIDHFGYDCSICGFNFEETYGEVGKGAIHVHHIIPLHKIKSEYKVNPIKDLITVCPNCHLILHRENSDSLENLKNKFHKKT